MKIRLVPPVVRFLVGGLRGVGAAGGRHVCKQKLLDSRGELGAKGVAIIQ